MILVCILGVHPGPKSQDMHRRVLVQIHEGILGSVLVGVRRMCSAVLAMMNSV